MKTATVHLLIFIKLLFFAVFFGTFQSVSFNRVGVGIADYGFGASHKKSVLASKTDSDFDKANCTYKNIKLFGRVKIVDDYPDIRVKIVADYPDLEIKYVDHATHTCGEWRLVEDYPDFTIKLVNDYPDLSVRIIEQ